MKTFRHKPNLVQAVRFDPSGEHRHALPREVKCQTALTPEMIADEHGYHRGGLIFSVANPKGWMKVFPGDYVVYGAKGEVYPVAPATFEEMYEEA